MREDNYIDLSGVSQEDRWCPEMKFHSPMITENGINIFSLEEYSITQMVIKDDDQQAKLDWFYVDTGADGHAIHGFHLAKKVLFQTMKMHQEVELLAVERLEEPL